MDSRRLLKFKYGGSSQDEDSRKVFVKFEKERGDGAYDVFTFECNDEPHPDLNKRLQNMVPHLRENCELTDDTKVIVVRSVTCTHKEMEGFEVHGLVISGLRTLSNCNAPMNLTSPHKTDRSYNEEDEDDTNLLSSACLEALDALSEEVFAYVDGKRSQLELGLETETKASA